MSLGAPKTEDDVYNEVRSQLAKILMTQEHTIYNIERQSKEVSEYPIQALAQQAGFRNTKQLLEEWYEDLVEVDGTTIRAYSSLYDTPELQHIISLQERTKMKAKKGGFSRRGRGGGGRGGGRAGMPSIRLREPPPAFRREPPRQDPAPRRDPPQAPPPRREPVPQLREFVSGGGFTVRRPQSPGQMFGARREASPRPYASSRRQGSPGGESYAYEQPSNRITSPYGHERRASPPHSVHSYSSARTQVLQPEDPMAYDFHPQQSMGRGRGPPDFVERSAERDHTAGPPPGFIDNRPHMEVNARGYESFVATRAADTRAYDYEFDDDVDPFGVDTARTLHTDDYANDRSYQNGHREERRSPPRQEQFYDEDFERDFYIPQNHYEEDRRPLPEDRRPPPPRQVYEDRYPGRESVYNYQNGNGIREERGRRDPSPPPQQSYDRYGHHRVDGVFRERNGNRTPEVEIFHDAVDDFNPPNVQYDSYAPKIDLPPCRTFNDAERPFHENSIALKDYSDISADIPHPSFPVESTAHPYSRYYIDYFTEILTDIHYFCSTSPSHPSFNYLVKGLPQKTFLEPGYDAYSIYCVMKALGPEFFTFHEDLNTEPGFAILRVIDNQTDITDKDYEAIIRRILKDFMPELAIPQLHNETRAKSYVFQSIYRDFPYFVKLNKTLKDEKELENELRDLPTLDMVVPYPRALCIYYKDDKPYRAQIIAELRHQKISVELVDVGVFLTVHVSELKRVEGDALSRKPRYAIPVQLENFGDKKLVFEEAADGFPRKATNKTVSMILTPKEKYMSMTLD